MSGWGTTDTEFVEGYSNGGVSSSSYPGSPGDYDLVLKETNHWRTTEESNGGYGLQGLKVTLNASDANAPLYEILSNDGQGVIVESTSDLSGVLGNTLLGVHTFETCLLYTSPSPRDGLLSRMPSSA